MNIETIIEAVEAAKNISATLEEQLYNEKYGMDPWIYLEVQTDPTNGTTVKFLGEYIWYSEDDKREWEERDYAANGKCIEAGYEPLEPYLRKKMNELVIKLSKIKL